MNTNTGAYYDGAEVEEAKKRGEPLAELPHKPNPDCRKCKGRGTRKSWGTPYAYGACPVCYPDHPQKARSFTAHLSGSNGKLGGLSAGAEGSKL